MEHRIIILDGSDTQTYQDQNKRLAVQYEAEYLHAPSMLKRHYLFHEKIDTEFVAWCADDDLIIPSFYSKGAQYLTEHKEYSVVSGRLPTLHYFPENARRGYYLRNYLGNQYDIFRGDFVERIIRKDQAYAMSCPLTFYGVRRYDDVKLFNKYVLDLKLQTSAERLENIVNLLFGGMKVIDELMGFRDYSSEATRSEDRDDPETYLSHEDIAVLENVIRKELNDTVPDKKMLDYYASYAWPLPLRPPQVQPYTAEYGWYERIEKLVMLYTAHWFHPFDKKVTRALRHNITKYSGKGSVQL